MTQKLDYNNDDALQILNSEHYTEEEKKQLYQQYMESLKRNRKGEIVNRLNECAKRIPSITKDIYISKIKEYENDDLSKPFEVIEKELLEFEMNMKDKYEEYLKKQDEKVEEIVPEEKEEKFDDTIFSDPMSFIDEEEEEVKPSLLITDEMAVLNEQPTDSSEALFTNSDEDSKEVFPDFDEKEKGNASAIILSIIALIIGVVVMYSIIRLN